MAGRKKLQTLFETVLRAPVHARVKWLLIVLEHLNRKGISSTEDLAEAMGLSIRTTYRLLDEAEQLGLIFREAQDHRWPRGTSCRRVVQWRKLSKLPPSR